MDNGNFIFWVGKNGNFIPNSCNVFYQIFRLFMLQCNGSERKIFTESTLYMDFDKKNSTEILKNASYVTPVGFLNEQCIFLTKSSKILKFGNHVISPY